MAKHKLHAATTAGSVFVSPNTPGFQSTATVGFSTDDPAPWAHIYVFADATTANGGVGVLQETWLNLLRGETSVVLGPTPSWSGGGGTGLVRLVHLEDGVETLIAETSFTVV